MRQFGELASDGVIYRKVSLESVFHGVPLGKPGKLRL